MSSHLTIFLILVLLVMNSVWSQSREEIAAGLKGNPDQQAAMIEPALLSPDPALHLSAIVIWSNLQQPVQYRLVKAVCNFYPRATDEEVRMLILKQLSSSEFITPETTALIIKILESQQEIEQMEALWVLARWNRKADFALPTLIALYPNASIRVQELVLRVLISIKPQYNGKIVEMALSALPSPSIHLRCHGAFLLGMMAQKNDANVIAALQERLKDTEPSVVIRAVEALGKLSGANDTKTLQLLWELRGNDNAQLRISVFAALLQATNAKHPEAGKWLQRELFHSEPLVRLAAATAVLSYDPQSPKALSLLVQSGQQFPKDTIAAMGQVALAHPPILDYLDRQYRQNPSLRMSILASLWLIHSKTFQPPTSYFKELLTSERDPEARAYLQQILEYSPRK